MLDILLLKLSPRSKPPTANTKAPSTSQRPDPPLISAQSAKHKTGRMRIRSAPCKNQRASRRHNATPTAANAIFFIASPPRSDRVSVLGNERTAECARFNIVS